MILLGDCLERLKELEDNSVDAVVTDPPYGLKFMGKKWDANVPNIDIWLEVLRVLKPGGHLLSFGGTRTYHRMVVAIEDAGFEIRDQIIWCFGSGFPKSHNGEHGGTALKPANEPIVLARKPLGEKTVALNFAKWGVGGLNIDESRIASEFTQIRQTKTSASVYGGNSLLESKTIHTSSKDGSPQGRWPANLLLDETAAKMLDEQSGPTSTTGKRTKNIDYQSEGMFPLGSKEKEYTDSGGPSRFFYVAKASKRERNAGLEGMPEKELRSAGGTTSSGKPTMEGRDRFGSVQSNNHPTVKPIKLMEYLCKLITPPGGVILDPFCGSGSTLVAAQRLGFEAIGIEQNAEYVEIAKKRIEAACKTSI